MNDIGLAEARDQSIPPPDADSAADNITAVERFRARLRLAARTRSYGRDEDSETMTVESTDRRIDFRMSPRDLIDIGVFGAHCP